MKEFNWINFKDGITAVSCKTKELAEDFFEQLLKNDINYWCDGSKIKETDTEWVEWENKNRVYCYDSDGLYYSTVDEASRKIIIEWENECIGNKEYNKEKYTLLEVFERLKNEPIGTEYEGKFDIIKKRAYSIVEIIDKEDRAEFLLNMETLYTKVKKYKIANFEEAFKCWLEGANIKSKVTNAVYDANNKNISFEAREIKGEWYILKE